jgi:hypothetical protein
MSEKLEDLKKEATELGIKFSANIGEAKLQEKIDQAYEAKESGGVNPADFVEEETPKAAPAKKVYKSFARRLEEEARKTKVVTIIDNDQRQNNYTTTAVANCSNQYFDLGTVHLPLGEKIEVRQGHLDALKSVKIQRHVRDSNTGLTRSSMVPRYSITEG